MREKKEVKSFPSICSELLTKEIPKDETLQKAQAQLPSLLEFPLLWNWI